MLALTAQQQVGVAIDYRTAILFWSWVIYAAILVKLWMDNRRIRSDIGDISEHAYKAGFWLGLGYGISPNDPTVKSKVDDLMKSYGTSSHQSKLLCEYSRIAQLTNRMEVDSANRTAN